jgi:catechol 2,3-dioxygenase
MSIDPGVRIGHVHLKVADLDRALAFYRDVLGFELTQGYGARRRLFLPAAITIILDWTHGRVLGSSAELHRFVSPRDLYPTRASLADALRRLSAANIPLDGATDHGVSEALYLRDPDDNGVELLGPAKRIMARTPAGDL